MVNYAEECAEDLYRKLSTERQTYLDEAHRSATVTIPALFPDNQDIINRNTPVVLEKPFQSLGARGINNLASKLLLTLFPPTSPFMKYELSAKVKDEAEAANVKTSQLQSKLARREQRIQAEVDIQGLRTKGYQILRNLLVGGNMLVYQDPYEGGMQLFPLNAYVTKRDGRGNLLDLIYVEKLAKNTITKKEILDILAQHGDYDDPEKAKEIVLLFTRVIREGNKFTSWQEVCKKKVPGTEETFKAENLPWLALRYTSIDGEDYGRGFVEEYRGDLTSFEQLSRDMQFASANAAKVLWGIDPNSTANPKKFMDSPNGGAITAREEDIFAISLDKASDMSVAHNQLTLLQQALAADFLLNSSFQRQQERVTAEEIRRMAEELDDTLGGVYSLLSQELQLPVARNIENYLIRSKGLPKLPKDTVNISVVTGLAAIGRGQDLMRLREGLAIVAEIAPVIPGLVDYIKEGDLNTRIWTGTGVDTEGLLFTEDEVTELRNQRQAQVQQQTLGQEAAKGVGKIVGNVDPGYAAQAMTNAMPQ